jgi:hypothetical protein
MLQNREQGEHGHDAGGHPETGPIVTVTVDTNPKEVHRGSYTVADFKATIGVDSSLELEEVISGELTPLKDDGRLVVKGGEEFFSHVRTGGSS